MRIVLLVTSLVTLFGTSAAIAEPPLREITFVVDQSKVRLSGQLTPANLTPDGKATVTAKGALFDPAKVFVVKSPWRPDQSEPLATVENYYKASVSGTDQQTLAFWHPDERVDIKKMLDNPDLKRRNREVVASIDKIEIKGFLDFPHYRVVFIAFGRSILGVNTVEKDGKWYLTNKPPNDLAVAIAEAAFTDGTVTQPGH